MKRLLLIALLSSVGWGQVQTYQPGTTPQPDVWYKAETTDPMRGYHGVNYRLYGEFLVKPNRGSSTVPMLDIYCSPGKWRKFNGRLAKAFVDVGAVLDASSGEIRVAFRLDGGKLQDQPWGVSTNYNAISIGEGELDNILYGHILPHKKNKGEQVHEILIGVHEYLGGEIQMKFTLPDASEIADVCGVTEAQ